MKKRLISFTLLLSILLSSFTLPGCKTDTEETDGTDETVKETESPKETESARETESSKETETVSAPNSDSVNRGQMKDSFLIIDDYAGRYNYNSDHQAATGWQLDNRGGEWRDADEEWSFLKDTSKNEGTAMIRQLNTLNSGLITTELDNVSLSGGFEGASLEYRNESGEILFRIVTKDRAWVFDGEKENILLKNAKNTRKFGFKIIFSIDDGTVNVIINNTDCGTYKIKKTNKEANLAEFRFATSKEDAVTLDWNNVRMSANYALYSTFHYESDEKEPYGCEIKGNVTLKSPDEHLLSVAKGQAVYKTEKVSGIAVAETEFNFNSKSEGSFVLSSDGNPLATFSAKKGDFYLNGKLIYEDFSPAVYYRIRLIIDFEKKEIDVRLNGRKLTVVPLEADGSYVNSVTLANSSNIPALYDEVMLFEKIVHDDYVPTPVKPLGEEKYTVGINVCSLWTYNGWYTVSSQKEIEPIIGWYDEGNPETADWEIKYLVEHGVDFQSFCWYPEGSGPLSNCHLETHMRDGYMNAEYSEMMKYAVMWEGLGNCPTSFEQWKKYYVPHIIEHFFKDGRYMTIDNKPIFTIVNTFGFIEKVGGLKKVEEMFDYLEEEAKKLGFDGVLYISCNDNNAYAPVFDGYYPYNYGSDGSALTVNQQAMQSAYTRANKDSKMPYPIATVSTGFNCIVWKKERYPLMSYSNFDRLNKWVRDKYLTLKILKDEDKWAENLVMLSNWNEFGEGTYLMPTAEGKFGYLDAIRNAYTDAGVDESANNVPTAAQKERITRKYPQSLYMLRAGGRNKDKLDGKKNVIYIDGRKFTLSVNFDKTDSGARLYSFEPHLGIDFALGSFHTWDQKSGTLTLELNGHKLVYTVGSDKYSLDGTEKDLGYKMYLEDNLPMLSYEQIATDVGYRFKYEKDILRIEK